LTHAVVLQRFQLVSWGFQVHQFSGSIQHPQLASGDLLESLETLDTVTLAQLLRFPAAERLNHYTPSLYWFPCNVNQYNTIA
jgi:hypothetical protein